MTKEEMKEEARCVIDNYWTEDFSFYLRKYGSKNGELTYQDIAEIFIKEFTYTITEWVTDMESYEDE